MTISPLQRKLAIAGAVALVALGGLALALRHWAEGEVAQKLHARLAGTDFALEWDDLSLGVTGKLRLSGLRLQDRQGHVTLAEVAQVDANIAVSALLAGQRRLDGVRVSDARLHVDVVDGQVPAWQRLQAALQKRPDETETGNRLPLLARLGHLDLQDARAEVTVTRGDVVVLKTKVSLAGLADFGEASTQLDGQLDEALGGAKLTLGLEHPEARLSAVRVSFAPGLTLALQLLRSKLPPELRVTVGAVAAEKAESGWRLAASRLALATGDGEVATLANASVDVHKNLMAAGMALRLTSTQRGRWLPEALQKQLAELGLAGEWTATVADVRVTHGDGPGAQVDVRDGALALAGGDPGQAGLRATVGRVTATLSDRHTPLRLAAWTALELDAPTLTIPLDARLLRANAALLADIQQLVALRKPADEPDEEEAGDEVVDPDALPAVVEEDDPTHPPPKGKQSKEKPATRWTRTLNSLHRQLFLAHPKLEALWPVQEPAVAPNPLLAWLDGLSLDVTRASTTLIDGHGKPVFGLREGHVQVRPTASGVRAVTLGAEPFDPAGSWGQVGVTWQREGHGHRLDLKLSGAGVAQLLAMKAKGLAVEQAADIELLATVRLPDPEHIHVSGRLSVDHMGIHWWRLADRPIADLHLHMPFELHALKHPGRLTFLSPDVLAGGSGDNAIAHLVVVVDVAAMDQKPRIRVDVDAPMQDSTEMLHAIPPSLLPTIGRIDAHGPLSWHVGVIVPLASPGASFVDLALGDTLCVMDKFGNIDLEELNGDFDRPVNENGTILEDVHIGPMSEYWTPLTEIPHHVTFSMWATEDSFYRHRGISESLTSKALSIDLSYGRFIYGGSTITQQLVKNIYLTRTKALSRKFEELLIAWQMERELGKARILEIYLNGVEFGPQIYGITRAAWAFFGKTPAQLSPKEGVYLAIIKPSPRNGYWNAKSNGWGDWYEMKMTKYMDRLLDEDFISPETYEAERPFKPVFDIQKDDPP